MGSRKIKYLEINDELGKVKKKWKQTVMGNILAIYWKSSLGEVIIILQISVHMKEGHLYTHQKLLFVATMWYLFLLPALWGHQWLPRFHLMAGMTQTTLNATYHSCWKRKGASYCTSLGARLSGKGYQKSTTENHHLVCWFLMINWSAKQKKLPEDGKTFTPLPHLR